MAASTCETSATPATPRPRPARASLPRALWRGVQLGLFITLVLMLVHTFFASNLHVVVPGRIYRSAQLTPRSLDRLARTLGIRTVINLRGYCPGLGWYREESRACNSLGLSQEDLAFSAGHLPHVHELRRLIEVIDRSEYPILFHCFRGVDRTGLASTMALLLKTDTPLDEARRSLSLRYLHLPFGRTGSLDRFIDFYATWLEKEGEEHTQARFRQWVLHEYRGGANVGRIELVGQVIVGPDRRTLPAPVGAPPSEPNARLTVRVPRDLPAGVLVRFHNTSDDTWNFHPDDRAGMHAFWRILHPDGTLIRNGRAGLFHQRVAPGEHIDLLLTLPTLWGPGKYFLQIGMVEEQHCFFQEVNLEPLNVDLEAS